MLTHPLDTRDLMDQILDENPPGQFRQAAVECFSDKVPWSEGVAGTIQFLTASGWLQSDEAALAVLPVQAAWVNGHLNRWPIYLALGLERVGIPLRVRGAFRDDPSLAAAVSAAAARNP